MNPLLDPALAWETFYPIKSGLLADAAPAADEAWLVARGFAAEAGAVFRAVRDRALPLVRKLEKAKVITWYSLFVHDRSSGVPVVENDTGNYLHLQMRAVRSELTGMVADAERLIARADLGWVMTRHAEIPKSIAGLDLPVDVALDLLGQQSALYLAIVEAQSRGDDVKALRQVRQHMHFFANMMQGRVG